MSSFPECWRNTRRRTVRKNAAVLARLANLLGKFSLSGERSPRAFHIVGRAYENANGPSEQLEGACRIITAIGTRQQIVLGLSGLLQLDRPFVLH